MSNVKKNFIYNTVYNILVLIIPLITAPYLARVIQVDGVGISSYSYSIAQYFVLFAILGLSNYGNRSIAKVRDNTEKLNKTFSEIYSMQIITSLTMITFYGLFLLLTKEYKIIFLIQSLYVISSLFDISWLFFGVEKFKTTVLRNAIIKVLSTIAIFAFVKNKNDTNIYILINALSMLASQFMLWIMARKIVKFIKPNKKDILKHFAPNLKLFIPVLAISLYNIMDKVMLGIMINKNEVGYYENAEKIIQIPITIISALGTVMLPRITNLSVKGENNKIKNYIYKSIKTIMFISIPISAGLIIVGRNFCVLYFGKNFYLTGLLIEFLSCIIIFKSWANVIRTQYLIPKEKDKIYITSVCIGAVINLIINILLIPRLKSIGACIGTILAEFTVMFYQTISVRRELNISKYLKETVPFILKTMVMAVIIYPLNLINMNKLLILSIQVIIGASIYSLLNIKYINSLINLKKIIKKLKLRKKEV